MKNGQFFVGKKSYEHNSWAIQAYENGWRYVCGTYGNVLTESILQDRASVFSGEVIEAMNTIGGVTRTKLAGRNKSNVESVSKFSN